MVVKVKGIDVITAVITFSQYGLLRTCVFNPKNS